MTYMERNMVVIPALDSLPIRSPSNVLMLGQLCRRWPNIKTALVFTGPLTSTCIGDSPVCWLVLLKRCGNWHIADLGTGHCPGGLTAFFNPPPPPPACHRIYSNTKKGIMPVKPAGHSFPWLRSGRRHLSKRVGVVELGYRTVFRTPIITVR